MVERTACSVGRLRPIRQRRVLGFSKWRMPMDQVRSAPSSSHRKRLDCFPACESASPASAFSMRRSARRRSRADSVPRSRRGPVLAPYAGSLSFIVMVVLLTCVALVLGELVTKRLALTHPEARGMACGRASPASGRSDRVIRSPVGLRIAVGARRGTTDAPPGKRPTSLCLLHRSRM